MTALPFPGRYTVGALFSEPARKKLKIFDGLSKFTRTKNPPNLVSPRAETWREICFSRSKLRSANKKSGENSPISYWSCRWMALHKAQFQSPSSFKVVEIKRQGKSSKGFKSSLSICAFIDRQFSWSSITIIASLWPL